MATDATTPAFWLERWREGRIGFHRTTVQPWLSENAARLLPRGDECVLVPLCGKSVDLCWLEARGHPVVGVEIAEQAVREFVHEQRRHASLHAAPPFRVFASGSIEIWVGDFFDVDPRRHGTFPAIYDRAAMIALPRERRTEYARRVIDLLAPRGRLLLITLEYDAQQMAGPPFCVAREEVAELYGSACVIERIGEKSIVDEEPRWRAQGLDRLVESCCLLTKRL